MKRSGFLTNTILALGLALSAASASAETLDLSSGTMTLGLGTDVTFRINQTPLNNIATANLAWNVNLTGGYFIMDNLSIDGVIGANGTFVSGSNINLSMGLGAHYYFDTGSCFFPYIGVVPTFGYMTQPSAWTFNLPVDAGVLVALNSHVALNVGATAGFGWNLTNSGPTLFNLSVGHLGVKAFF